jgi:hypothetical protein
MEGEMSVADYKRVVQQLEQETRLERIPVSRAALTIVQFCEHNGNDDPLLTGIPASMNPFKEKKSCSII